MQPPRIGLLAVLIVILLLPISARAGTLIVGRSTDADTPGVAQSSKIHIEKGRIRVDTEGAETVIFRNDRRVMWYIDQENKTYIEMTRDDLERMASRMGSDREQLRARMQQLPPEQRKAIEQMMPGGGSASAGSLTYKKVRSGAKVGRWACDVYEGYRGAEKQAEICVADRQQLGMTAEDLQTLQQFGELVGGVGSQVGGASWVAGVKDPQKGGFPGVMVRGVVYHQGKPDNTWEVTEARSQSSADSFFEVPAGFRKESTK